MGEKTLILSWRAAASPARPRRLLKASTNAQKYLGNELDVGMFQLQRLGMFQMAFLLLKLDQEPFFFSIEYWESRILVSWILRVGISSNCEFTVRNAEYLLKMSGNYSAPFVLKS